MDKKGGSNQMKNVLSGFVTCLGLLSSVFALEEKFSEYKSVFLVLIGVCVGFFLGRLAEKDRSAQEEKSLSPVLISLFPPTFLIALIVVLYFTGTLTDNILSGVLVVGFFFIFFFELIFFCTYLCKSFEASKKDLEKSQKKGNEKNS